MVFINFYAEWCRFSNILQPIFDEAADKVREAFPDAGSVVMGKVDCDKECKYWNQIYTKCIGSLKVGFLQTNPNDIASNLDQHQMSLCIN